MLFIENIFFEVVFLLGFEETKKIKGLKILRAQHHKKKFTPKLVGESFLSLVRADIISQRKNCK